MILPVSIVLLLICYIQVVQSCSLKKALLTSVLENDIEGVRNIVMNDHKCFFSADHDELCQFDLPLISACKNGYDDIVQFLLEKGFNPTCYDSKGDTLIAIAKEYCCEETILKIAEYGKLESFKTIHQNPYDLMAKQQTPNMGRVKKLVQDPTSAIKSFLDASGGSTLPKTQSVSNQYGIIESKATGSNQINQSTVTKVDKGSFRSNTCVFIRISDKSYLDESKTVDFNKFKRYVVTAVSKSEYHLSIRFRKKFCLNLKRYKIDDSPSSSKTTSYFFDSEAERDNWYTKFSITPELK